MEFLGQRLGDFRASTVALWRLVALLVIALLPMVISKVVQADAPRWRLAAIALGSLLLVPIVLFGLLAPFLRYYRVTVYQLGLRAFNGYGKFFTVRWTSMKEAHRVDLLVLPYLRVRTTEEGVELVIPMFLAKQREFERLVVEHAGPLNPLSRHFQGPSA
jgi:hypothetical protein